MTRFPRPRPRLTCRRLVVAPSAFRCGLSPSYERAPRKVQMKKMKETAPLSPYFSPRVLPPLLPPRSPPPPSEASLWSSALPAPRPTFVVDRRCRMASLQRPSASSSLILNRSFPRSVSARTRATAFFVGTSSARSSWTSARGSAPFTCTTSTLHWGG